MKSTRKRPTYTFTLDKNQMDELADYARSNRLSLSFCMRIAVRNFARSLRQKRRACGPLAAAGKPGEVRA